MDYLESQADIRILTDIAAVGGRIEVANYLVDLGADISASCEVQINAQPVDHAPLTMAVQNRHFDVLGLPNHREARLREDNIR